MCPAVGLEADVGAWKCKRKEHQWRKCICTVKNEETLVSKETLVSLLLDWTSGPLSIRISQESYAGDKVKFRVLCWPEKEFVSQEEVSYNFDNLSTTL